MADIERKLNEIIREKQEELRIMKPGCMVIDKRANAKCELHIGDVKMKQKPNCNDLGNKNSRDRKCNAGVSE